MATLSTYAQNGLLNLIIRNTAFVISGVWVSLHTAAPDISGTPSNEVSAGWYNRVQPAVGWNAATIAGITNNGAITFPAVTGSSVTVTHVGIYDASTGGNLLWFKALSSSKLFGIGSIPTVPDTSLSITTTGNFSNYIIPKLLEHLVAKTAYTTTQAYLAMYTTNPTAADSGTECTLGSYARQLIEFDAPSGGVTSNTNEESFGVASSGSQTISHYGIRDALTLGNLLLFNAWDASALVESGDTYKLPVGNLDISLT